MKIAVPLFSVLTRLIGTPFFHLIVVKFYHRPTEHNVVLRQNVDSDWLESQMLNTDLQAAEYKLLKCATLNTFQQNEVGTFRLPGCDALSSGAAHPVT